MTKKKAVDPDVTVRHHSVELDEDALLRIRLRQRKVLAIDANPAGAKAPAPPDGFVASNGPAIAQS